VRRPLVGITEALHGSLPATLVDVLRVFFGVSGTFVLIAAVSTSIPARAASPTRWRSTNAPALVRALNRRTLFAPKALLSTSIVSCGFIVAPRSPDQPVRRWRASSRSACCSRSPPRRWP
jgi:hypothetical protein